jgi:16S rRNA C967 or C1407 C5-methylase (RsmB/RsmF family)/NOL1/NOP2/fmu family ribosome biogenesis protein
MNDAVFPEAFVRSLQAELGAEAGELLQALRLSPPVSIRYNIQKHRPEAAGSAWASPLDVPWCSGGVYLSERPAFTLDPLLHGGAYYVQEASSMFLAQLAPLVQAMGAQCRVLDLCAAPGGKSTLMADLLPPGALLVSNETMPYRAASLLENMVKWGFPNTVIAGSDPKWFRHNLAGFFDVLLVDAPCSGEGMFRKDPAAVGEWSPSNVALCVERQRRIVADAWLALREGGLLVYSTCTFNRKENEENVEWIQRRFGAEPVWLPVPPEWGIVRSDAGYRFYPHRLPGEGFFVSLLRKTALQPRSARWKGAKRGKRRLAPDRQETQWLTGDFILEERAGRIEALPALHYEAIEYLSQVIHIRQAGVPVGEQKGNDTAPSAALALSTACRTTAFAQVDVDRPEALTYLRRESVHFSGAPNGFLLVCYRGLPLGWAKKIGARTNNLFPLPWRIKRKP